MSHGGRSVFVDTNVLVYADQGISAFHYPAKGALERLERDGAELWISRQVLREYLAAVTRPSPLHPPMLAADAAVAVERFTEAFWMAEDGPDVTAHLLDLLRRVPMGGKQIHDANLVATMLAHGITRLLTFNAADFRRFGPAITLEPVGSP